MRSDLRRYTIHCWTLCSILSSLTIPSLFFSTRRPPRSFSVRNPQPRERNTMTIAAVLISLLVCILTIIQANSAAVLPTLEARQTPQSGMPLINTNTSQSSLSVMSTNASQSTLPVIDTHAFNQCFKNDWFTREGSQCYAATYDFEICFKYNQTMWLTMDPASIYMCVCLPWPKDGRTMVNDTNLYAFNRAFLLLLALH